MEIFCNDSGKPVFATCLNCIDGRTHFPVINWIKEVYGIDYVDLITEPGMVGAVSVDEGLIDENILKNVSTSISKHNTRQIFIVAHYDCAGNPVNEEEQRDQLLIACKNLKSLYPQHLVSGLWLDHNSEVSLVFESGEDKSIR